MLPPTPGDARQLGAPRLRQVPRALSPDQQALFGTHEGRGASRRMDTLHPATHLSRRKPTCQAASENLRGVKERGCRRKRRPLFLLLMPLSLHGGSANRQLAVRKMQSHLTSCLNLLPGSEPAPQIRAWRASVSSAWREISQLGSFTTRSSEVTEPQGFPASSREATAVCWAGAASPFSPEPRAGRAPDALEPHLRACP